MIRLLLPLLFFTFAICHGLDESNPGQNGKVLRLSAYEYFPYMVSIKYTNSSITANKCGGSIIAKRTILTAAHCISGSLNYQEVYVVSGINDLLNDGPRFRAEELIIHPDYNSTSLASDIGLIIVNREIEYTQRVNSIGFANFGEDDEYNAFVIGWGKRASDLQSSNYLKFIYVRKVDDSNCEPELQEQYATMCILTYTNEGLCPSDDGGPVVYQNKVVGVVSGIHNPCGDGRPQVVTGVSKFSSWIKNNIR